MMEVDSTMPFEEPWDGASSEAARVVSLLFERGEAKA